MTAYGFSGAGGDPGTGLASESTGGFAGGSITGRYGKPPQDDPHGRHGVHKTWGDTFNCSKDAGQVLNYLEQNFASLASTTVGIGPTTNVVTFSAANGIIPGATVSASVTTFVGPYIFSPPGGSAQLSVQSVGNGGFTLQPNPAVSPLNGSLSFSASNAPNGQINFAVQANATYSSLTATLLSSLGKPLENGIWNNLLGRIRAYCNKK